VHPPASGTTPLHLAASLGRADIVAVLLDQAGIDDTLRDNNGKTCKDVAKVKEVIQILQGAYSPSVLVPTSPMRLLDSRSFLNASYRSLLRSYILSPMDASPNAALVALLESPRARGVDLSYLDDASGTSLLHEAARRKNLRLIELAVRAGASVFVRDRRGKMAYEGAGKDDHVRVFLRQCTFFLVRSLTHGAHNNDSRKPRYLSH
jgi:ankyrin repeat protein